jgi:hypothetical protein
MTCIPRDTGAEIARICGYIFNDASIAAYIGCRTAQVAAIRAKLPRRAMSRLADRAEPIGYTDKALVDAVQGTASLHRATIALFQRQAVERGHTVERAMLAAHFGVEAAARFTTTQKGHQNG